MISINQSNLLSLKTYYQFTREQLENLQNQVRFVMEDQSAQITITALLDVLTTCEQSANISIELLKFCQQLTQDKNCLFTQIESLKQQNLSLVQENNQLYIALQVLQESKRQSSMILNQIQYRMKIEKNQYEQSDVITIQELMAKECVYKVQLKYYENELQICNKKNKKLELEISNLKQKLALKNLQLQLAEQVLQDLQREIKEFRLSQYRIRDTHSSSQNHFCQEILQSKKSINEPTNNKRGSLMQDLVGSQIIQPELSFRSHFKYEIIQTVPQIQQSTSQIKNGFFELQQQSKKYMPNAYKKDKKIGFQKVKDSKQSLGVVTQHSSRIKRIHEWLRAKVITQRIKM